MSSIRLTSASCSSLFGALLVLALAAPSDIRAQQTSPIEAKQPPGTIATQPVSTTLKQQPITVTVLDFDAKDPARPDLGKNISDVLTAVLGSEESFRLVDRTMLETKLREQAISLTGLVDTEQAVKIGKLVGAKILVTGRCFVVGQQMFLTAKLIGVETSLVKPVLVKGVASEAKLDELVTQLAMEVRQALVTGGSKLVAREEAPDPVPALIEKLSTRKLPRIAVVIPETHMVPVRPTRAAPDPAAETEIKMLLTKAGIEVQDVDQNDLAGWTQTAGKIDGAVWPRSLSNVDLVVTGKGFSELGAQIGSLVSCSARVEINVIARENGRIVLPSRATTRDVDLSENIASKKALQKAGRTLGIEILSYLADTLPPAPKPNAIKEP